MFVAPSFLLHPHKFLLGACAYDADALAMMEGWGEAGVRSPEGGPGAAAVPKAEAAREKVMVTKEFWLWCTNSLRLVMVSIDLCITKVFHQ